MSRTVLTLLIAAGLAAPALGADRQDDRAALFKDAVACRAIAEDSARLACYDRTVAKLDQAESTDQIVVMDQSDIRKTRRSLFGFVIPKIKLFEGNKNDREAIDTLDTTVASVSHDANGALVFTTPEGATWHQLDDRHTFGVKPGTKVTIKTATLGSFFAKFEKGQPIRVKRER